MRISFEHHGRRVTDKALRTAAAKLALPDSDELLARIGCAEMSAQDVLTTLYPELETNKDTVDPKRPVSGLEADQTLCRAECCQPLPGERIVGITYRGRGVAAGTFISFTPLHGFHFLAAAGIAWVIGGNILAALLATFVGNPVTFPFIAYAATWLGREIMGNHGVLSPKMIFGEFADATAQLWQNLRAVFGPGEAHWDQLGSFYHDIFLPYLVGGVILGTIAGVIAHYMTVPVIRAYHKRRSRKMAERIARVQDAPPPATPPEDDKG